jgi:TolB protein
MELMAVRSVGGPPQRITVRGWNWETQTGTVRIVTHLPGGGGSVPARLSVIDATGHAAIPDTSAPRFDGELGRVFFYSPGIIDLTVPEGDVTVYAVRGLATPEATETVRVRAGETLELRIELDEVWNAGAAGWMSGEHHFHLNYGGPYDLDPGDLIPMMQGEDLDVATPLLANLHNRFEDQDLWRWRKLDAPPLVLFGQEVRSHFLGHIGMAGTSDLYWPWVWGPGYQVYGTDDRPNTDPLQHARSQGGIAYYVHPVSGSDPFQPGGGRPPVELIADAVLGDLDALEIVCLWSDDLSTAAIWHRFLNLGIPVAPSAGTDVMNNFYRTMAIGTTRVYAYTGNRVNWSAYLDALRAGHSFVTSGPLLDFTIDGARPGGVVQANRSVRWNLELHSAVPVDRVDILLNGRVVEELDGLDEPGSRDFDGTLDVPDGGWVAARAHGGEPVWPSMAVYPFAHTAPVWIDHVGSVQVDAERLAAEELLRLLDASEVRLREGYGDVAIPRLSERFAEARRALEARLGR